MDSPHSSDKSLGGVLSLSVELNQAKTAESAANRAIELANTAFDQPAVSVCRYDPATETINTLESSFPASVQADSVPDEIPELVAKRFRDRNSELTNETPEVSIETDPWGSLQVEAIVPAGRNRVLRLGLTDSDSFESSAVTTVEGIAANLETALNRIDQQQPDQPQVEQSGESDADALRRLNELIIDDTGFDETMERLLSLGCDHFELATGILSQIDGDDYEIEAVVDPTGAYEAGDVYDLADTMCHVTVADEGTEPLAFADVVGTEYEGKQAAADIRAYIAAPVVVDGTTYGTVNFSMASPRSVPFSLEEREFVRLVAQWVGREIGRHRQLEELERYETILDAVGDPVYALDATGAFTFVNAAAKREFGYGTEIIGERPSVGMEDADIERIREQIEELLATGEQSATAEFELETANDERTIVENQLALIGDDEFRGSAGILRDITTREERRQQLESFQRAVEEAADGIAILDGDEYSYVDQSHVEMYGFDSKEELLGKTWRELYADEEVERLEQTAFPKLESDGYWRGLVTGQRPDGSTFPAELALTIIDDGRLVCTVRDETERRARERELELKEQAMDEADVGIQITGTPEEGNPLVYVNNGFEQITGYTREESLGRNPRFLQGTDTDTAKRAQLREAISSEEPVSLELQNARKDGTPYWSRLSITPVTDENGDVQNYIGIQQDVTERREREQQQRATVEALERIYEVTTDPERSFEEKLNSLLTTGNEYLDLPYGYLTQIKSGDEDTPATQTIIEAQGSHELIQPDESAPLSEAYCRKTVTDDGVVAITNAGEAGWKDDPAYEKFGLETYIAGAVGVAGQTYGTLCFAASTPRKRSFTATERMFVSLLRRWVGYEIDRRNSHENLQQQRERLELTLSGTNTGLAEWDLETDAVTWDDTLAELTGRNVTTAEEFIQAVHPDDRDRVQHELETLTETGDKWTGELRLVDDDGNIQWIGTRATIVSDDEGPDRILATATDISDEKKAEREQRRNERRFQSVFEDPEMLVALLDTDGTVLTVNETATGYVDATRDAIEGEKFAETPWWNHSTELQADVREWTRRAANGEYVDYEASHPGPDGDTRQVTGTIRPVTTASGTVESLVVSARDVTERNRQQQALEDRQRKLDLALSNTDTAVAELNLRTRNMRWEEDIADGEIGSPETVEEFVDAVHPDDREQIQSDLTQMADTGNTLRATFRLLNEGGEYTWVDAQAVPTEDEQGGTKIVAIATDVSDLKGREEELELKERAMDEANVGITISDPNQEDNPLIYANDGFVEQTGYPRSAAVGRNCRFLQTDDRDQPALDDLRSAIAAGEPITVDLRNYRQNGEQFWNRLSVTPVYDNDGQLMNYIGIQQDVTEVKVREQRLRALLDVTNEVLQAVTPAKATARAIDAVAAEFGFGQSAFYRQDGDELVKTATSGTSTAQPPDRIERGQTPLWDALETEEPIQYDDCRVLDDDIDRGDITASAYIPAGDHGVVVVGATDPDHLGESERQLIEVLTGNLAAVLDSFEREESIRASEQRYRSLAENIPNGCVLTFDAELNYRLAAGDLLSRVGFEPSDISGEAAGTVLTDSDAGDELVPQFQAALDGEPTDRRIELGDRTIRMHIAPVDSGNDERTGTQGLVLAQDITDEARRQQELFEERERFRLLTESVDEYAFLVVDEDGAIQTWNESAETMFGYDAEAALGMSMAELHPEADRESDLPGRLLQQARVAGESAHEGWRVRADGSEFYGDVRYAPLETDGDFRGFAKIVRDMTDRRRQQRRTEQFVEQSNDVVTIVDPDGTINYASGSANRVLGYDPDDIIGENLFDYLHPEGREDAMETFFAGLEDPDADFQAECRLESGDGEWLNVEGQCRNRLDDDAIDGMLLYLRDVTESKERARRFESIFNQTFQFTGLLDPDGTVMEANDAVLEFGGIEREAIVGQPLCELSWWKHADEVYEQVRNAIDRAASGEFVRYETEVRGADGLTMVDFSLKPVTDDDGAVTLLVAEGRDISQQQQQRQHMEVMQRVMRHNMRNDLTKMRGWTQVMCEEENADKRAEQFETIEQILDKWDEMTEKMKQIRQLIQQQKGDQPKTDTAELIEAAVAPTREEYADTTITTSLSDGDPVQVPTVLLEAVRELVGNAADATDAGQITVGVDCTGDRWTEISVKDDGPGLPEMEADVLETGEETALNHGQGLGLWMVRTVVTQAGGDVSVESSDDGTDVCLRLPTTQQFGPPKPP